MLAALVWGAAEATLFFIVPDVIITVVAVRHYRRAIGASLVATLGALCGGSLMFGWGRLDPAGVLAILDHVPAVSTAMIDSVSHQLDQAGLWSLFTGPLTGTPYKIYAAQAGAAGIGLAPFLLVSVPARLLRFLLLATAAAAIRRWLLRDWSQRQVDGLAIGLWGVFYVVFLALMPG